MSALTVSSPMPYQPFQRTVATNRADIAIAGTYTYASSGHIEASWNGGAYARIATITSGTGAAFSGSLTSQPSGQGTLTVRIEEEPATATTVAYVTIGDGFNCIGQSNMEGRGEHNQTYSSTDGFKGVQLNGSSPATWAELGDPSGWNPSSNAGGSFLPLLGTLAMNALHVPVFFVNSADSGTPTWSWIKPDNHWPIMAGRLTKIGNATFRWTLVWVGETDSANGVTQAAENGYIDTIANDLYSDYGCTTFWAKLHNTGSAGDAAIQAAIAEAWGDNAHTPTGPDLSDIGPALHPGTDGNLATVADRFWTAIAATLPAASSSGRFSSVFAGVIR